MSYQPSEQILEKYAKVLVNFALNSGRGVKSGEVVRLNVGLSALPMYRALVKVIIDSGAHVIGGVSDDMSGAGRYFYDNATTSQLNFFPAKYGRGLVEQIDHSIAILSDYNIHELDGVDPKKIMQTQKVAKPMREWIDKKENNGKFTWTLALYGTPSMAKEASLSLEEYWAQIIHANFLDRANPIAQWQKVGREVKRVSNALTKLEIESLHMVGADADLQLKIGAKRKWLGGSGRNIPSFEVFTSPDWRGTEGWIRFNQPLYRYGQVVRGIELHFEKGRVVRATASKNQNLLLEMLATDKGASQIGEFSLTDRRLSRINKFMAETLFDENMGGPYGNTHLAVGRSFYETYTGSIAGKPNSFFNKLGFNSSAIHTDMISTANRTVTATLKGGTKKVIYKDGLFII
jgi:aminopeptidase